MLQDLRYALRVLMQNKGWTVVVVLSVALGIGANTALFTVVNEMFMRKLPVRDPDTLVRLRYAGPNDMVTSSSDYGNSRKEGDLNVRTSFSYPMFQQFLEDNRTLDNMTASAPFGSVNLFVDGAAEIASAFILSGNYYRLLGVEAFIGRTITPEDDQPGAPPVAMISHGYWSRRFGSSPEVIGKVVRANNLLVSIVGVAPSEFTGIQSVGDTPPEISFPLALDSQLAIQALPQPGQAVPPPRLRQSTYWWLQVSGRLRPDVTLQQVQDNLEGVFQQTARAGMEAYLSALPPEQRSLSPNQNRVEIPQLRVSSANRGLFDVDDEALLVVMMTGVVVTLILLIVCANVANLLLSRATLREKEMSVRLSMGVTRGRLIRQLLTESVILALMGGGLGLLVAYWGRLLWEYESSGPFLDWRVLLFTSGLATVTGVLFGVAPAFRATSRNPGTALKDTSRSVIGTRSLLGKSLLAIQVAVSVVLLIGAGLFLRTLQNLRQVDVGFDPENIVLFRVNPQLNGYDQPRIAALYAQMVDRLRAIPGVGSVGMSSSALLSGNVGITRFAVQGGPVAEGGINTLAVGPGFFETMGIPVVAGRTFTSRDDQRAAKAAIINEAAARKYFPDGNPLGRRFGNLPETSGEFEIIGIVRDARYNSLREAAPPTTYMAFLQNPLRAATFELRTSGDVTGAMAAIRQAVRDIDPEVPVTNLSTQIQQIEDRVDQEKTFATTYAVFGGLALLLSSIGLFGLMSYSVTRRTNEIGVRMALGAMSQDVVKMIMRESMLMVAIGIAIGLAAAIGAGQLVTTLLFGLAPTDGLTISIVVLVMIAVSALAGYLPARRAARVDPLTALRYE